MTTDDQPVSPATHRFHYSLSYQELAARLGVKGDVFRVWSEDGVDYLHLLVFNPEAAPVLPGGYADDQPLAPRVIIDGLPIEVVRGLFRAAEMVEQRDRGEAWDDEVRRSLEWCRENLGPASGKVE
jgi:hypothetical protein